MFSAMKSVVEQIQSVHRLSRALTANAWILAPTQRVERMPSAESTIIIEHAVIVPKHTLETHRSGASDPNVCPTTSAPPTWRVSISVAQILVIAHPVRSVR
uniref:Uncharacterized protein n=1 Tax=Cacopsylla melanoneura TaxID=428564 RepID=A0A8D8V384_9HEMI